MCAKFQNPWITNSIRKVTRRERRREHIAINSGLLVAEEESLEELQGSEIFESDLDGEIVFFFVKNFKLKMMTPLLKLKKNYETFKLFLYNKIVLHE